MPKFNLDINGVGAGAAEGREQWSGEAPPTGTYEGVLKVMSVGVIANQSSANYGKTKFSIGVEFNSKDPNYRKYNGFIAWGNLNMIDSSVPYINQFLHTLTNGSESEKTEIEKAFYGGGIVVDERKKHVTKIGKWNIGSPEGGLPIRVSVSSKPFYNETTKQTTQQVRVESYLFSENTKPVSRGVETAPAEEADDYDEDDLFNDDDFADDGELLDAE